MWAKQATATPERPSWQRRVLRGLVYGLYVGAIYRLLTDPTDTKMMQYAMRREAATMHLRVLDSRFRRGEISERDYHDQVEAIIHALFNPSCR